MERLFNISDHKNLILDFFSSIYFGVFYAQKGVLLLNVCLYVSLKTALERKLLNKYPPSHGHTLINKDDINNK